MLTEELIRKHAKLIEAKVTVKAHTAHSKRGKTFNVKQHTRTVPKEVQAAITRMVRASALDSKERAEGQKFYKKMYMTGKIPAYSADNIYVKREFKILMKLKKQYAAKGK